MIKKIKLLIGLLCNLSHEMVCLDSAASVGTSGVFFFNISKTRVQGVYISSQGADRCAGKVSWIRDAGRCCFLSLSSSSSLSGEHGSSAAEPQVQKRGVVLFT